jgi:hypothetical protein
MVLIYHGSWLRLHYAEQLLYIHCMADKSQKIRPLMPEKCSQETQTDHTPPVPKLTVRHQYPNFLEAAASCPLAHIHTIGRHTRSPCSCCTAQLPPLWHAGASADAV